MQGYELYSSTIADVLSEPSLHTPITVGLFARWGSGKSFLISRLRSNLFRRFRSFHFSMSRLIWFDSLTVIKYHQDVWQIALSKWLMAYPVCCFYQRKWRHSPSSTPNHSSSSPFSSSFSRCFCRSLLALHSALPSGGRLDWASVLGSSCFSTFSSVRSRANAYVVFLKVPLQAMVFQFNRNSFDCFGRFTNW